MEGYKIDYKYKEYAIKVLDGTITANRYIRLACERYLGDIEGENSPYYLDTAECDKCINFIEHLTLFKEEFVNQRMKLLDWQVFFIYNVFGIRKKSDDTRKYKQAMLFIGRKNGKSVFAAAITLYHFLTSPPNSEFIFCANSTKQAKIAFEMVCNFVKKLDTKKKLFRIYRDSILFHKTNSKLFVLSSESSNMDGYSANFLCDEVEGFQDDKIVSTLRNGQGAIKNPLGILIGTSGYDKKYYYSVYKTAIDILEGNITQENFFPMLFQLDEGDDWQDETNWIKANPSLGVTIKTEFLKEQVIEAVNNPSVEVSTRTKNFNTWCDVAETWIPSVYIDKAMQPINLQDWKDKGINLYVGLDLSSVQDMTALSFFWEYDGKYYFKNYIYLPNDTLKTAVNKEKYKQFVRNDDLILTDGNVVDMDYVFNKIKEISKSFNITKISYDAWNSTYLIVKLTEEGFNCQPFSQTAGSMTRPLREFERKVLKGEVTIDRNLNTKWQIENSVVKCDWNNNAKIVKTNVENKIDVVYAMFDALGGYLTDKHYNNEIMVL